MKICFKLNGTDNNGLDKRVKKTFELKDSLRKYSKMKALDDIDNKFYEFCENKKDIDFTVSYDLIIECDDKPFELIDDIKSSF